MAMQCEQLLHAGGAVLTSLWSAGVGRGHHPCARVLDRQGQAGWGPQAIQQAWRDDLHPLLASHAQGQTWAAAPNL